MPEPPPVAPPGTPSSAVPGPGAPQLHLLHSTPGAPGPPGHHHLHTPLPPVPGHHHPAAGPGRMVNQGFPGLAPGYHLGGPEDELLRPPSSLSPFDLKGYLQDLNNKPAESIPRLTEYLSLQKNDLHLDGFMHGFVELDGLATLNDYLVTAIETLEKSLIASILNVLHHPEFQKYISIESLDKSKLAKTVWRLTKDDSMSKEFPVGLQLVNGWRRMLQSSHSSRTGQQPKKRKKIAFADERRNKLSNLVKFRQADFVMHLSRALDSTTRSRMVAMIQWRKPRPWPFPPPEYVSKRGGESTEREAQAVRESSVLAEVAKSSASSPTETEASKNCRSSREPTIIPFNAPSSDSTTSASSGPSPTAATSSMSLPPHRAGAVSPAYHPHPGPHAAVPVGTGAWGAGHFPYSGHAPGPYGNGMPPMQNGHGALRAAQPWQRNAFPPPQHGYPPRPGAPGRGPPGAASPAYHPPVPRGPQGGFQNPPAKRQRYGVQKNR